jgi:Toastrack DUF4097
MTMKAWFGVAAVVVASGVAGTAAQQVAPNDPWCASDGSGSRSERACEVREVTLPAGAPVLEVDSSPNGGIDVKGTGRGDLLVRAKVTANAETEARAREIVAAVRIDAASDRIAADGPRGLGRGEGWSVSYRLEVPTRTSLKLESVNGGINVSGVDGQLEFQTTNGGVSLAGLSGDVRGRTTNGGVNVDLDGASWQGTGLDVRTSNGGVRLKVPAAYSAQLEAETVNGGLNIEFPVTIQGRRSRQVQATLGAGGPLIHVQTSNGGVSVTRK